MFKRTRKVIAALLFIVSTWVIWVAFSILPISERKAPYNILMNWLISFKP